MFLRWKTKTITKKVLKRIKICTNSNIVGFATQHQQNHRIWCWIFWRWWWRCLTDLLQSFDDNGRRTDRHKTAAVSHQFIRSGNWHHTKLVVQIVSRLNHARILKRSYHTHTTISLPFRERTLKTRDWKRQDWKTRDHVARWWKTQDRKTQDLKNVDSVTKHKCSNNVERESKVTALLVYRACAMWPSAFLWDVRQRGGTSWSWLSHLPHRHSDDPAFVLT